MPESVSHTLADDPRRAALLDALEALESDLRDRLVHGEKTLSLVPAVPAATQPLPNPADLVSMLLLLED